MEMQTANKFEHAKIYRISSLALNLTYYGSTLNRLSQRMAQHRSAWKGYKAGKAGCIYYTAFDVLEADDAAIFLVETFKCNNIEELKARERHHIENNMCVNKTIPGRTMAEYRVANQETIKVKEAAYRAANQEAINAKSAAYYAANWTRLNANQACPCGGKFTMNNRAKHEKTIKHRRFIAAVTPVAP